MGGRAMKNTKLTIEVAMSVEKHNDFSDAEQIEYCCKQAIKAIRQFVEEKNTSLESSATTEDHFIYTVKITSDHF